MEKFCDPTQLNESSYSLILQNFFNDSSVKVIKLTEDAKVKATNDSFNSDIDRWTIQFSQNGKPEQEIKIIIKASRKTVFHRRLSRISRPFAREIFWFNVAYPELVQKFPELEKISPVCYYAFSNYLDSLMGKKFMLERHCGMICWPFVLPEEKGLLILENLKQGDKRMKLLDKSLILTYPQAKLVIEAMARFHGVWLKSIHLLETQKDYFQTLKSEHIQDLEIKFKPWMMKDIVKQITKHVATLLRNEKIDEDIIKKWENYGKTKLLLGLLECGDVKLERSRSKIITICHGDPWSNNMLFSEDEDIVTFIDYQMLCFGHPARDIWYFLGVSTDREFRRAYLRQLLQDYFQIFHSYVVDTGAQITFDEFESEILERRNSLLSFGLQIMPNVLSPHQIDFGGWRSFSIMSKKREVEIAGSPKADDHPMVLEIRRRIVDIVLEAEEAGFI